MSPFETRYTFAVGLRALSRVSKLFNWCSSAISILVMTIRSATAACFRGSSWRSSCPLPKTASEVEMTPSKKKRDAMMGSLMRVCKIGAGSANPVVSIRTRLNCITSPLTLLRKSSRRDLLRSPLTVQHKQPVVSSTMFSSTVSTKSWSMPMSPNSLTRTAVSDMSSCLSSAFKRVVFPLPSHPVKRETWIASSGPLSVFIFDTENRD